MPRLLFCLLCLAFSAPASAEDWPAWRGPRGDGSSHREGHPHEVRPEGERRAGRPRSPAPGYSSPIVSGDRVFVTSCIDPDDKKDADRVLICLDRRSGKDTLAAGRRHGPARTQARASTATPAPRPRPTASASTSPSSTGQAMQVVCYGFDGKKLWQKSPGKLLSVHGFCTSPVLHKDLVILNGDQDAKAYLVALDKNDGSEKWRADRPNRTRSYCTPILIPDPVRHGVTQLVLSAAASASPATTPTPASCCGSTTARPSSTSPASSTTEDILFLTTGFPEYHLMGIRPDGKGNITQLEVRRLAHRLRQGDGARNASYVPSPCAYGGHFFVVADAGYLVCLDAKTGKIAYRKKLGRRHSASPIVVEGNLIIPDDDGKVHVVKAGPKFEVVATNDMKEPIFASPATAGGQLFLRTTSRLYCIGAQPR